jgi:hypothetical protein
MEVAQTTLGNSRQDEHNPEGYLSRSAVQSGDEGELETAGKTRTKGPRRSERWIVKAKCSTVETLHYNNFGEGRLLEPGLRSSDNCEWLYE